MVGLLFLTFASSSVCIELGLPVLMPFPFGALANMFFQQFAGGTYLSYCLRWFFKFGKQPPPRGPLPGPPCLAPPPLSAGHRYDLRSCPSTSAAPAAQPAPDVIDDDADMGLDDL